VEWISQFAGVSLTGYQKRKGDIPLDAEVTLKPARLADAHHLLLSMSCHLTIDPENVSRGAITDFLQGTRGG
jgi:hypothetical protein